MARFRRGFRRGRRARPRWLWTGIQTQWLTIPQPPGRLIVELASPSLNQDMDSEVTLERVVFELNLMCLEPPGVPVSSPHRFGVYISPVVTDLAEIPVPQALWDPISTDLDAMNKRPIWWRLFNLPPAQDMSEGGLVIPFLGTSSGATNSVGEPGAYITHWGAAVNAGQPYDLRTRRRLKGDEALCMVIMHDGTSIEHRAQVFARCLLRVGRR